jgi:hypothetical protein
MDEKEKKRLAVQLSTRADLSAYAYFVAERTKYGKKPGPHPWTYTRRFMKTYGDPAEADQYIALWTENGIADETTAARWILQNERLLPDGD